MELQVRSPARQKRMKEDKASAKEVKKHIRRLKEALKSSAPDLNSIFLIIQSIYVYIDKNPKKAPSVASTLLFFSRADWFPLSDRAPLR
jgi:hypothetical protein